MSTEIWVAIIGLVGVIITVLATNKVTLYRIGELEKKQDKYNHLQERTAKDERDIAVIKEDIKSIKEKIEYLHGE